MGPHNINVIVIVVVVVVIRTMKLECGRKPGGSVEIDTIMQ